MDNFIKLITQAQSIVDSGAQDFRIVTVPNGNHGKITAMDITKTIEVYPSKWDAHYAPFPRLYFHFRDGVINWVSKPDRIGYEIA